MDKIKIHRYPRNVRGRTFIAGDAHGCVGQLIRLLAIVDFDFDIDTLYLSGDLGDRGPDSYGMFQFLRKHPNVRSARGNHDLMIVDAACEPHFDFPHWIKHGGQWAVDMRRYEPVKFAELVDTVREMPDIIVVGAGKDRINIFHGEFFGTDADLDSLEGMPHQYLSIHGSRRLIESWEGKATETEEQRYARLALHEDLLRRQNGLSPCFVGHSIVSQVMTLGSHTYLDTCAFGAEARNDYSQRGLTLIDPYTRQTWRADGPNITVRTSQAVDTFITNRGAYLSPFAQVKP